MDQSQAIQSQAVRVVRLSVTDSHTNELLQLSMGPVVTFDGYTKSKEGGWWAQICGHCVDQIGKDVLEDLLSYCDNGFCGVHGCSNPSEFYIELPSRC